MLAALVGGRAVGLAVAVFAAGAFNLVFLEPFGTFKVASVDEAIAFVVFGLVALTVATLVAREGERRRAAVQRTTEVEALWRENEAMQAEQARLAAEKQALEASTCSAARCCGPSHTTYERRWPPSERSSPISATESCTTPPHDRNCSSWSPTKPSVSTASSPISSR